MVRIFKSKGFNKLTRKEKINDEDLINAIKEVETGLFDADLGGQVYKKRLARKGQGKRGGYRTIILFKRGDRAFFAYGFPKNEKANITDQEEEGFKELAKILLKLTDQQLQKLIDEEQYYEIVEEVEDDKKI